MRIAVTGLGVVSALGVGVDRNFAALAAEQSGISPEPRILKTAHRLPVGELKLTNEELHRMCGVELKEHLSRTALLGILAVREAIEDARLASDARVGLVSATSVGGMDLTEHFFEEFMADERRGRLRDVRMHDCAASTEAIAAHCHIRGYRTTISTACSSSANAILQGLKLLRHGILDAVVVGGTDALSAFTLNGFKSLMILDEVPCRPFDASRRGLNLGEGAGYLVLQREGEHARDPYCYVAGAANSNDAHHQTASSEEGNGALLAMQGALQMAGVDPSVVDYVNVHGTGTGNNDLSEGRALLRLFGDRVPAFSSTKGFTGHTLAAAGGIEAVYSALAIARGVRYANLRFETPIAEHGLVPEKYHQTACAVSTVLSNSFGFGGNCSSVLFTK